MGGAINTNSTLGSSNFDGTLQATVKANTTAGFSIVTYTGTGGNTTVGHGLGVAPEWYILKSRDNSEDWAVYVTVIDGSLDYMYLNTTAAKADSGLTAPTSSVIYRGSADSNGEKMIMYCFSEVAGYSKFGKYIGNGNANGTYIYTGFRPAWIMVKRIDSTKSWPIFDNKRDPDNVASLFLYTNTFGSENNSAFIDFLSNGFKFRTNSSVGNDGGNSYVYFAFAESPFKNARAR
jgi:hypothetical protein